MGGILKSNSAITDADGFNVGPTSSLLNGAGAIAVKGNDIFIASLFSSSVRAFNAITGAPDPAFTPITGLGFPESISIAPDGNSLLVGILGPSGRPG